MALVVVGADDVGVGRVRVGLDLPLPAGSRGGVQYAGRHLESRVVQEPAGADVEVHCVRLGQQAVFRDARPGHAGHCGHAGWRR